MSVTLYPARVAAALLESTLLFGGAFTLPAYAAPDDGTITVTASDAASEDAAQRGSNPIIRGCTFDVEFHNFGNFTGGVEVVQAQLSIQGGQGSGTPVGMPVTVVLREPATGSFNGGQEFTVPAGLPVGPQGIHLKVDIERVGAPTKSVVFWLDCAATEPTTEPSVIASPTPSATASPGTTASPGVTALPSTTASPGVTGPSVSAKPHEKPVKVNAGGESDASGLIVLGVAGAGVAAAAGYGLTRGRKRD
jgi:hypothetical protein